MIFSKIDVDNDGELTCQEFMQGCQQDQVTRGEEGVEDDSSEDDDDDDDDDVDDDFDYTFGMAWDFFRLSVKLVPKVTMEG